MSLATLLDFATKRISNYLILLGLSTGLLLSYFNDGLSGLVSSILGALIGLLIFIYPYAKSLIGAGDVKLMAVAGSFLGPHLVVMAALYASTIGGLVVLVYLLYSGLLFDSLNKVSRFHFSSHRIPYAFAISTGACLALLNPNLL